VVVGKHRRPTKDTQPQPRLYIISSWPSNSSYLPRHKRAGDDTSGYSSWKVSTFGAMSVDENELVVGLQDELEVVIG
jgi:hypothetical protein